MSTSEPLRSHILIADEVEGAFGELQERLQGRRVVSFIREDFLIEDAKAVINEAYISEESTKYIVLGGKSFNSVSQNALLKVLEEPPNNIEFILIAPSKSIFLPTIRSRLPIVKEQSRHAVLREDSIRNEVLPVRSKTISALPNMVRDAAPTGNGASDRLRGQAALMT